MSSCEVGREEVRKGWGQDQVANPREPVAALEGSRVEGWWEGARRWPLPSRVAFFVWLFWVVEKKRRVCFLCY